MLDRTDLRRVIGEQSQRVDAQILEDGDGGRVLALIGPEPEVQVCLDGIEPTILKVVGVELVEQTDPLPSCRR